jgi:eukaryotic-like serine/threonine-protein kinase
MRAGTMATEPDRPAQVLTPPREFDEYELVSPLGRGAMGQVYVGLDRALDRHVAIKFIGGMVDPSARARFMTEARAVARLQHPQVVTIYRVGEADGWPYIVSELVRGQTLDKLERPVPWRRVVDIGHDLARGLAAAHKSGVLHRDIKPSNAILGDDGNTKLLDFGLAKLIVEGIEYQDTGERRSIDVSAIVNALATGDDGGQVAVSATIPAVESPGPGGVTVDGTVVGTPLYLAPERWRGEPASRATDLYSLGAILYELVTGSPPHEGPNLAVLGYRAMTVDPTPVHEAAPECDPRLAAVIDRCVAREPKRRFHSAEALASALAEIASGRAATSPDQNPYRGLLAFEAEHRAMFFGREAESRAIVERLKVEGFILVAGDSGVGKSSLCRAGVLAAVEEGALGDDWSVISMVPGARPMTALEHALARAGSPGGARESADDLASEMRQRAGRGRATLLFIDQLEELVTLSEPAEAGKVADFIGLIASTPLPGLRLLATVRSDFLTRVSSLSGLRPILSRSLFLLPPLTAEGLRDAIVGPAGQRGFSYQAGTVDALVAAITSPAGLPLLQFTLAELWDARDRERRLIPRRALDELGGVEGALARHGDKVLASLLPGQRPIARQLLTLLVTAAGTRARRTAAELVGTSEERREVLEALVRGRLVAAEDSAGEPSYELVHEALISGWRSLRDWLDDESAGIARRERLRLASSEWNRLGRGGELLWTEPQLREIEGLDESGLDEVSRSFVARSRRAARRRRRLRQSFVVLVVAAVLATYGLVKLQAAHKRDHEIDMRVDKVERLLDQARAANQRVEQLRKDALAEFDRGDKQEGELHWRTSRAEAIEVDRKYIDAISLLDQALVFDPTSERVRGLLAGALFDRILLAERDGVERLRGELVVRLGSVDPSGEWKQRLAAPGHLTLSIAPAGAAVQVERYVVDARRRRVATPIDGDASGPLTLPPGSYRLVARAPGRAEVRYPFTLARGEQLAVELALPLEREVPRGFVHVPPGRFLVGSAADDELRSLFFAAPPQHAVSTGGFLVARHETTFAEWIAYLEDIAPDERARRTPRAGPWGIVELRRLGERQYEITITSGKESYRARTGEELTYRGRDRRDAQHWERFPVSGIAPEDVAAYLAWLDRTGRVKGARMCSELEWERAARGADDREYPHGDALEPDDANYLATYGEARAGPDEIGSHPASESPFGAQDMVGNVFELTRGITGTAIVVRGGAFIYDPVVNRIDNRVTAEPGFLGLYVGFRVCAPAPSL